jgi:chromosome segregation ATPase
MTSPAHAQTVYRWVDAQGEVHYGHAVPPEHAHRGYERLRRDGSVRESVDRALTAEERAERTALLAAEAEAEATLRNQESRDRLLLAAYNSEQDITTSMDMQISGLNSQRSHLEMALQQSASDFERLVARAAQLTRDGQTVPAQLTSSIQETRSEMQLNRQALDELDDREEAIRNHFASELERYRQLTGSP